MPGATLEDELSARVADDPGDDPERRVSRRQAPGPARRGARETPAEAPARSDERAASDAADLLAAKDDDGARADALDRLDRGDDAERAVEATAPRDACRDASPTQHVRPTARACPKRLPCAVDLDLEPGLLAATTRTSRCASSSAAEGCGRFAPGPPPIAYSSSSRSRIRTSVSLVGRAAVATTSRPASGTSAASRNATAHDVPDTVAAKTIGASDRDRRDSTDCWKPIAAPLRAGPASSAAAVNASAFQPIDRPPARASAGTSSHSGPPASAATTPRLTATTTPDLPQRADPRADDVRPAAGPDPDPDREHLRRGDHERRVALGEPVLVVEEHDAEAR